MNRFLLSLPLVLSVGSFGCASNLHNQLDACVASNAAYAQADQSLRVELAKAQTEQAGASFWNAGSDLVAAARTMAPVVVADSQKAWDWAKSNIATPTRVEADRASACYKDAVAAHPDSVQDYKALAVRCWNNP
jgi:hypothetical protein